MTNKQYRAIKMQLTRMEHMLWNVLGYGKPIVKAIKEKTVGQKDCDQQLRDLLETAYYMGRDRMHPPSEARALSQEMIPLDKNEKKDCPYKTTCDSCGYYKGNSCNLGYKQ